MADDRMKNDDLQKNMGGQGEGRNWDQSQGQQTPGRNPKGSEQGGGQYTGKPGDQKDALNRDEEEFGGGTTGQRGGQSQGGQNR